MRDVKLKDHIFDQIVIQALLILTSVTQESIISSQVKFRRLNSLTPKLLNSLHDFLFTDILKREDLSRTDNFVADVSHSPIA